VLFFLRPYISTSLEPIYRLPLFSDHADRTHQDVIAAQVFPFSAVLKEEPKYRERLALLQMIPSTPRGFSYLDEPGFPCHLTGGRLNNI